MSNQNGTSRRTILLGGAALAGIGASGLPQSAKAQAKGKVVVRVRD